MNVYDLGRVPWIDSQLLYHAMPRVGEEGLLILAPSSPYVCIGWHQDLAADVDLAYCKRNGVPVFRREVGGGAVYLDGNQIFFQLVLSKDNPLVMGDKTEFYQRMLAPVVNAYADLGVTTRYRPVNDVITEEGRKISGTGAAEISDSIVLVGNLIEDFDYAAMSKVLKVPDEKFRDKVFQSMQENLTTLRRQAGRSFEWGEMADALISRFAEVVGPLTPASIPEAVRRKADELSSQMLSAEWLSRRTRGADDGRDVKIATGVNIVQRVHKAPGGLMRAVLEIKNDRIVSIALSGDFFCYPGDGIDIIESELEGVAVSDAIVCIEAAYSAGKLDIPGVTPEDWRNLLGP